MKENNQTKKKRIKFWISISVCGTLFLSTILLVMWFILLRDHNRSSFVRSEETPEEIIKKNYIKGFENTKNSGEFSYFLPQDDMNNLLDAVQF